MSLIIFTCRVVAFIVFLVCGLIAAWLTWYSVFMWEGRQITELEHLPGLAFLWLLAFAGAYGAFGL